MISFCWQLLSLSDSKSTHETKLRLLFILVETCSLLCSSTFSHALIFGLPLLLQALLSSSTPWGLCSQSGSKGVRETLQVQIGVAGAASPPPRRARAELWPPRDSHQSSPRLELAEFITRKIRVHDSDSAARAKSSDARRSELISESE